MGIFSYLTEAIFPFSCCSCGKIGSLLCDDCYNLIEFSTSNVEPTTNLNSISVAVKYTPPIQKLIHQLKFGGIKDTGKVCARLIYQTVNIPNADIITSVPIHRVRQKSRGYNQAEIIARELGNLTGITYVPLLERFRATKAQATTVSKEERQKNLAGAIKILPDLQNYHRLSILIVDDVFTTGSTLAVCAEELTKLNPTAIHGLTVASRN